MTAQETIEQMLRNNAEDLTGRAYEDITLS